MTGPFERIVSQGQIFKFDFEAVNVPDAAGTANIVGGGSGTQIPVPLPGAILGMAVRGNALLSTGTLLFRPTVNGSALTTFSLTSLTSAIQQAYRMRGKDLFPIKAGDRLGVDFTKTGTISPTTIDFIISLYVLLGDFEP